VKEAANKMMAANKKPFFICLCFVLCYT